MNNHKTVRILTFLITLTTIPSTVLVAQEAGELVMKHGVISEDLYVAGGRVQVLAQVTGDVVAAGGRVLIDGEVQGDVLAAGGTVDLRAAVSDDVRAAGGDITISGQIGDEVVAAGGSVLIMPQATIGGKARLAGGQIQVAGSIGKALMAGAGKVIISGEIHGDVWLIARRIEILPTAHITGNLHYRSPEEAIIAAEAQIDGTITQESIELPEGPTPAQRAGAGLLLLASLAAAAVVLFWLFPGFSLTAARTIETAPLRSFGLGLAVLATTPLVTAFLMASVIGIPIALVLLASFLVLMITGLLTVLLYLGDVGLRLMAHLAEPSKGQRFLSIVAAVIALALLGLVPIVGGLALFALFFLGLGALVLATYRAYAGEPS